MGLLSVVKKIAKQRETNPLDRCGRWPKPGRGVV
jgi:hypothetical protein